MEKYYGLAMKLDFNFTPEQFSKLSDESKPLELLTGKSKDAKRKGKEKKNIWVKTDEENKNK